MIAVGQLVRIRANDADVPAGVRGKIVRIHPDNGYPVVSIAGRPVTFLPDQIEPAPEPITWSVWDDRPLFVTFSATNGICLSMAAATKLAGVPRVEALYNRQLRVIGLRPSDADHALTVSRSQTNTRVRAMGLIGLLDLQNKRGAPAHYPARWEDDVLVVRDVPFRTVRSARVA